MVVLKKSKTPQSRAEGTQVISVPRISKPAFGPFRVVPSARL